MNKMLTKMKKAISFFLYLITFSIPSVASKVSTPPLPSEKGTGGEVFTVKVTNPSDADRRDVPVVVNLHKALGKQAGTIQSAVVTTIEPSKVSTPPRPLEGEAGSDIPSQLDDLDGDLVYDELAFVADIPALTTLSFKVVCSSVSPMSIYPPRVNAFMKVWDRKYRYPRINSIEYQGCNEPLATYDAIYGHGAQWESELVGFRVYMDHRQSIDIYGKPRPALTLDSTNFYSTREDIAAGLGCDILFAGASVGAGSFRGYIDGKPTYVDSVEARGQRVIASGPVRTIVEVTDRGWIYAGQKLQMRQLYTMYAGHRDVQVDITMRNTTYSGESDAEAYVQHEALRFCSGVQKLERDNVGFAEAYGLVGSWGLNVPDKAAEDLVEGVGLGVYAAAPYLINTCEDDLNYLTILRSANSRIRYHLAICALMEEGGFRSAEEWFAWLRKWRRELDEPCTIKTK